MSERLLQMGHAPENLREAFLDFLGTDVQTEADSGWLQIEANYFNGQTTIPWLLGQLCHCSDILPGLACDDLGLPKGITYADAARLIAKQRKASEAHFPCPECRQEMDFYLNVGRNHWGICIPCDVVFFVGSNLFSGWKEETESEWEANKTYLSQFWYYDVFLPEPGHPDDD